MKTAGLATRIVDGNIVTDEVVFPEAFINHTRLSVPTNDAKIIRFDCNSVEIVMYPGGHTVIHITKGEDPAKVTTKIDIYPETRYTLSRFVPK